MARAPQRRTSEPPAGEAQPIAAVLTRLMQRLRLDAEPWLDELRREWPTLVGADVAAHARPGRLDRTALVVYVDSSVWLSEIRRFGQAPLLASLQRRFGRERIASLRFQIDPGR